MSPRLLLAFGLTLALAAPAAAEMYKCVDSRGRTIFTSDPSVCPGQEPHQLEGRVQIGGSSGSGRTAPAARAARSDAIPGVEDGFEAMWRRKRGAAQGELDDLSSKLSQLQGMAKGCKRGVKWLAKDKAGLRSEVPCSEILTRHESTEARVAELQDYLARGLAEECRRAGCLPGWIR